MTSQWQFSVIAQLLFENVIDRSMTIFKGGFKIVIYRSMTFFCDYPTVMRNCHWLVNDIFRRLFQNCHWPVNDNFLWLPNCYAKMSLTGQWQFLESGFEIVIDQSMTIFRKRFQNCHWLVNDNFLWLPNCYAKLSLTSQWHF